jgi:DUF1365 family protein
VRAAAADAPAVSLYRGTVMHARMRPVEHRFSYRVAAMLIDIDRLEEANRASALFSVNANNLFSFHEADHGPRDGSSLRVHVDAMMREAGLQRPARVELLCYPAFLGYEFNPLSVFYCRDADGQPTALLYQVHNTFGESHTYVEPVIEGQAGPAGIRQERDKGFYVSPFMEMDTRYRFRMTLPAEDVKMRILQTDANGPVFSAAFHGEFAPLNTRTLCAAILQTAGNVWKVVAGIHFEALKLWIKGLALQDRPAPPGEFSLSEASGGNVLKTTGSGADPGGREARV